MNMNNGWAQQWFLNRKIARAGLIVCLLAGIAHSQIGDRGRDTNDGLPEAEFHMARMIYRTFGGAGSRGFAQPWWAIDYPMAEEHFLPALRRLTNLSVADDSQHLELGDDRLFDYPFLFAQQVGQGYWRPSREEAERLREYLLRGGFLLVDDFHGEYQWAVFEAAMQRVLPGYNIIEIPDDDPLMHVFYDLGDRIQIPGRRHVRWGSEGPVVAGMEGPPHWRGIYDDHGRLMVAISFNIDMGDAWEHADDPYYPEPMTALAYRLGVNYVIYAMTH
ncbi:MAG: DUF4159 domain-containing protein [Acidobacteria bacterium]|nr:DUF4159 domain-containing protein [Acidobacteriota bacterium]